jgi:hypothetical protein
MPIYEVEKDILGEDNVGALHPSWCLVVVSFANPDSFDRTTLTGDNSEGNSKTISEEDVVDVNEPMIIAHDCTQLTTQTEKSSHVSSLSAVLVNGNKDRNYLGTIAPGDWILAWIANDQETIDTVIDRIQTGKAANDADLGLKFVGRVQSVRERGDVESTNGTIRSRTHIQAVGFREFDTSIYYDPNLALNLDFTQFLGKLETNLEALVKSGINGGVDVNAAMESLLKTLLGLGIPRDLAVPSGVQVASGSEAPYAYIVPASVATILGKTSASKKVYNYADILDVIIGLQRYSSGATQSAENFDGSAFLPDGVINLAGTYKNIGGMSGLFLPQIPQWTSTPFWDILGQFLNPAINEMYTCLRVNADNDIVPHFIVRQMPFTTQTYADLTDDAVTPYLELPRWRITPNLVLDYDLGRSNAIRYNFIHYYGLPTSLSQVAATQAVLRAPPPRDGIDIQRHGLHPDIGTVNCSVQDADLGAPKWNRIRADFQMGLVLLLNGTIQTIGIQAPICEGDNLEYNGFAYHIESVTHFCSVDTSGRRVFRTSLGLTHGTEISTAGPINILSEPVGTRPGITYEGGDK